MESDQWGAPCGAENGFFVIDVDAQHGGLETVKSKNINWGDTLIVSTPSGGMHVYYQFDQEKVGSFKNAVSILDGIDIRSTGGYIVLYGEVDHERISPIPEEILDLLRAAAKTRSSAESSAHLSGAGGEVMEGGRNHYLTKHAGRMQKIGVLTLASLQEINERDCTPPLDDFEVQTIFNSIARYAPDSTPDEDEIPPPKIIWASEMVSGMFEYLRDKGKTLGESTGVPALDGLLGGGKRLGELTVTMAEAKTGKNTFWHYQQRSILDRGIAIGYASRELSPETEVLPNLLTLKLGKNLYKNDVSEIEVMDALAGWKLAFAPGYGAFTGNELFDWLDECLLHGVRYFWIDHLHYCLVDAEDFKLVSEFGRKLKTYAKTHQVHIDLIVQPKNVPFIKVGDKLVPQELDIGLLRGGANLGQVLDSLITMQRVRDEDGDLTDVTKVALKRARSKLARPGEFFMEYQFNDMSFKECANPTEAKVKIPRGGISDSETRYGPKQNLTGPIPSGYGESKKGEFFNLKRSVDKMLGEIKSVKTPE